MIWVRIAQLMWWLTCGLDAPGLISGMGKNLEPSQPPVNGYQGLTSQGMKQITPQSSAKVQNEWSYTCISHCVPSWCAQNDLMSMYNITLFWWQTWPTCILTLSYLLLDILTKVHFEKPLTTNVQSCTTISLHPGCCIFAIYVRWCLYCCCCSLLVWPTCRVLPH
jgi:hypothetical protein